jgi:hypothetical protein
MTVISGLTFRDLLDAVHNECLVAVSKRVLLPAQADTAGRSMVSRRSGSEVQMQ